MLALSGRAQLAGDLSAWDFNEEIKEILEQSREAKIERSTFDAIQFRGNVRQEINLQYSWTSDSTLTLTTEFRSHSKYLKFTAYLQRVHGLYFVVKEYKLKQVHSSNPKHKYVQTDSMETRSKLSISKKGDTTIVKETQSWSDTPWLYYFNGDNDLVLTKHGNSTSEFVRHNADSISRIETSNDELGIQKDVYTDVVRKTDKAKYRFTQLRIVYLTGSKFYYHDSSTNIYKPSILKYLSQEYQLNKKELPISITNKNGSSLQITYN